MTPAIKQNQESLNNLLFICLSKINQPISEINDLDFWLVKTLVHQWEAYMKELSKMISEGLKGLGSGGSLPTIPRI
jgi:hypothetical protein